MPIEFHCPHCNKLLKTPEDREGIRANCPGCGELVTVPDVGQTEETRVAEEIAAVPRIDERQLDDERRIATLSLSDDGSFEKKGCPMCGRNIAVETTECPHCGEILVEEDDQIPHAADIQGITTAAWEIYKAHFGMLFVANLLQLMIHFCVAIAFYIFTFGIVFAVMEQPLNGRGGAPFANPQFIRGLSLAGPFLGALLTIVVSYVDAGAKRINLDAARDREVQLGILFTSGKFFFRIAGVNLIFLIPQMTGALINFYVPPLGSLIMLPGILILMLFFWPAPFVIIDRNFGLWRSLMFARVIAQRNIGTSILLGILALVLTFIGLVACLIGLLFTIPLMHLNTAVAYSAMTRRRREMSNEDG